MRTTLITIFIALLPGAGVYALANQKLANLYVSNVSSNTCPAFLKTLIRITINLFELLTLPGAL